MTADLCHKTEKNPNILQRLEFVLNVLNHICIGFVTIYMSWMCLRKDLSGTRLHAWLCTLGFQFLMAEGIMSHYSGNVLTFSYRRYTKTTIHWVLQVLGGGIGIAGALLKLIKDDFQMYSTHGKLGLAAFIICVISLVSGLSALFAKNIQRWLNPLLNKTFHILLGLATFVVALATQFYGYEIGFFKREVTVDFQILMKCVTLISLFLTSIGPLKALFRKANGIACQYS